MRNINQFQELVTTAQTLAEARKSICARYVRQVNSCTDCLYCGKCDKQSVSKHGRFMAALIIFTLRKAEYVANEMHMTKRIKIYAKATSEEWQSKGFNFVVKVCKFICSVNSPCLARVLLTGDETQQEAYAKIIHAINTDEFRKAIENGNE